MKLNFPLPPAQKEDEKDKTPKAEERLHKINMMICPECNEKLEKTNNRIFCKMCNKVKMTIY